ncbi:hypothetical protein HDU78_006531 [Chytriomyces hyalinus]|nr:hypothetical protein HDU78_006531 [Chytriomyces hyalinus]
MSLNLNESCGGFLGGLGPKCTPPLICLVVGNVADAFGSCQVAVNGEDEVCGGGTQFAPVCQPGLVCVSQEDMPGAPGICTPSSDTGVVVISTTEADETVSEIVAPSPATSRPVTTSSVPATSKAATTSPSSSSTTSANVPITASQTVAKTVAAASPAALTTASTKSASLQVTETSPTTWITPVIVRYILRGRKPADVYGMDHVLLNLQMDRVSRWLSMGLWTDEEEANPSSFAEACERLAQRVCGGRFKPGDAVADFGCGCGDQLKLWMSMQPNLKSITAVTSELAQARYATSQLKQKSIYSVIKVFVGDALKPSEWKQTTAAKDADAATTAEASPLMNGSIDSVVSLDACYHFNNRRKFLKQSIEILKPGTGLLSISDIILGPGFENAETVSFLDKLFLRIFCANASVPMENLVALKDYRKQIEQAGFVDIEIEDVTHQVFPGLLQFVRRQGVSLQGVADPYRWMQYGFGMASFLSWVVNKRVLSFVVVHARRK